MFKFKLCATRAYREHSNCVLPVPIGSSRNSNFEAEVLETHSHWAFLPMIFVISIFELTKTARSAFKVLGVGSIGLLVSQLVIVICESKSRPNYLKRHVAYIASNQKKILGGARRAPAIQSNIQCVSRFHYFRLLYTMVT